MYSFDGCTAIFVVLCTYIGANAYCHLIGRDDENILSSCIDRSVDSIHLLVITRVVDCCAELKDKIQENRMCLLEMQMMQNLYINNALHIQLAS